MQQHSVVDEWQKARVTIFPICVPCVHSLPSVSHCHMTVRCVDVINPQITTLGGAELCHRDPHTEKWVWDALSLAGHPQMAVQLDRF